MASAAGKRAVASTTRNPAAAKVIPAIRMTAREVRADGVTLPYQLAEPPGVESPDNACRAWPLILFLHGAGESGRNNTAQTTVGLGPWLERTPDKFPAYVLMPQTNRGWTGVAAAAALAAVRQEMDRLGPRLDRDRVYCSGISMGGNGTVVLAEADATERMFAAFLAVCAWTNDPSKTAR
jgi:predicted peptidase